MTESYGPGDGSIPAWTSPTDTPPIAPAGPATPGAPGASAPRAANGQRPSEATPTHRSWQPGIMPLRPMSFGDFLSVPFKAIRYNRSVVIGGPLACFLAVGLVTSLALWMLFSDLGLWSIFAGLPADSKGLRGETIAVLVVAGVMWLFADAFARAIVAPGVARAVMGEHISLGQAWGMVRSRVWQVLGLYGLATGVTLVPVALAVGLLALASLGGSGTVTVAVIIILIGALILLPAAMVYSLLTGVAIPLIVLERGGVMASVRRTFSLIKGRFWWSVLISFVASSLISIVSSFLTNAVQIGGSLILVAAPSLPEAVGLIIIVATTLIAYLLLAILDSCYLGATFALVYIDLRIRHEGFDSDLAEAAESRART